MLGWDGQLEDDARLVTTVARTAASYGAHVRTRRPRGLRDRHLGASCATSSPARAHSVTARTVINATGVWAGDLVDEVRLRPSRGTHLVLREETLPGLRVVVYAPIPGTFNRFVLVLPQPDGTIYVGLTDEPTDGPVPDVPQPTEPEIGFLLDVVSAAFEQPHPPHRRGGCVRRAPAAARRARRGRDRRHLAAARRPHQPHRRRHDRRRQADDLPPDGRGRRRRRARPRRHRRRRRAAPARCRCSARPTGSPWPGSSSRRGWSGATAPTPAWCSRPRAPPPA